MSSDLKDARWQLTTQLTEELGIGEFMELPYPIRDRLLYSAQQFLEQAPRSTIAELAKKWNTHDA